MNEQRDLTGLLARAETGDQAAWNILVDRYTNLLWSVARAHRLTTADAGDVVQVTWLKLVENLGRIHDPERLAGWLVTTARRECLAVLRRTGRVIVGDVADIAVDVVDESVPALDAALLEQERDAQLWACFGQLSPRCQQLLRILAAADRPAYSEVSLALGMPVGSIGPTRMRCLARLRGLLHAGDIGHETTPERTLP